MRRLVWILVWLSFSGVYLGQPSERVLTQTRVEGYGSETVAQVDPDLSEIFGREGYGSRPSAEELDKPAVFEYLIRDFFTRPWRYPDAAKVLWKTNGALTGVALLLLALVLRLPRDHEDQE